MALETITDETEPVDVDISDYECEEHYGIAQYVDELGKYLLALGAAAAIAYAGYEIISTFYK